MRCFEQKSTASDDVTPDSNITRAVIHCLNELALTDADQWHFLAFHAGSTTSFGRGQGRSGRQSVCRRKKSASAPIIRTAQPRAARTSRCVRLRSAEGMCTRDAGVRRVADECANVLVDELMQDERAVQEVLLYRERVNRTEREEEGKRLPLPHCVVGGRVETGRAVVMKTM